MFVRPCDALSAYGRFAARQMYCLLMRIANGDNGIIDTVLRAQESAWVADNVWAARWPSNHGLRIMVSEQVLVGNFLTVVFFWED